MDNMISSKKLLQALFQSCAEGILVVDERGKIILANPRCFQMFGYSEIELLGKPLEILMNINLRQIHARLREGFFEQPNTMLIGARDELYGRAYNGKIFPVEIGLSHMEVEGEKFAIAFIVDVTKQKKVADENKLLSKVFHESLNSVFVINTRNFQILKANTSALRLTGYTMEQLQQIKLWDLESEIDQTSFQQMIAPLFTGAKKKVIFETKFIRKNRSSFPTEIHLQIFEHEEQLVIMMIGIDITERKKAEVALKREKEIAQTYLETAASIFLVLDKEGKVILINRKGLEVIGYEEVEVIGKNWFEWFLPADEKERVYEEFCQLMKNNVKSVETFENTILTKNKDKRLIEWSNAVVYDDKGLPETILGSGVDITEKREAERGIMKALIEGQEAEREGLAKELHDGLGQHHTAMQLNLNAMKKYCVDAGPEAMQLFEKVKIILQQTILDMKAMSRDLMPGVLRDYGLVKGLEHLCQILNDTGLVKVNLQVYHMELPLDATTSTGLYRIVQEVVNNAIRHGKASEIQVQLLGHKESLVLLIEDDGLGFQQEAVISKSGFGLKNIEARVKALQGTFHIDSHPGQGTTINVEIPLYR
ncbi:PAS domain S-box protein [Catalinimonas sp. 4WD22]|uniref:sensor histidine kinase n=1 Tax=Catalinimonas locisalis TaxID=3133978 RepID=UPI00310140C9